MYTLSRINGRVVSILREDGAAIPVDTANADYRAFEIWNASQSPPLDLSDIFDLSAARRDKCESIDSKTSALLAAGLEYPIASGMYYSLSPTSQTTWLGMLVSKDVLAAQGAYPLVIGAIDGRVGQLADAAEVVTFYSLGLVRVSTLLQTGAALKSQVMAAATQAAIDAIVDDRE